MRKKIILWIVIGGVIILGALFRVLLETDGTSSGGSARRPAFVFEEDPHGTSFILTPEEIMGAAEDPSPSSVPRRVRKTENPAPAAPDLKSIKGSISPKKGKPGDMKDYLDEAERARAKRVGKSLKEIKEKVRDWQPNIFEPTW